MTKNANFRGLGAKNGCLWPILAYRTHLGSFFGLCRRNCGLKHIGGILELRKIDFRCLKVQFDVKKANFRGLTAKIGYLRPILTSITHL